MQETFIKAYDHIDELLSGEIESAKAWLMRIAVNTCKDTLRSSWMRHIDRRQEIEALPLLDCELRRGTAGADAGHHGAPAQTPRNRAFVLLSGYEPSHLCATCSAFPRRPPQGGLQQAQKKLRIQLEERG